MSRAGERASGGRIPSIDAARGVMILLMVFYHLLYDLVVFQGAPAWLLTNPVLRLGQPAGAGIFILLSGATSRVSRSNAMRGVRLGLAAAAITLVTYLFDSTLFVRFGILHFLCAASLLYAALRPALSKIPQRAQPVIYTALFVASSFTRIAALPDECPVILRGILWVFGFDGERYGSADYFPLLPWIFMFLFGTWFGGILFEGKCPRWVYDRRPRRLAAVGRMSFYIYVLHQPVLMGLMYLVSAVRGV